MDAAIETGAWERIFTMTQLPVEGSSLPDWALKVKEKCLLAT